MLCNYAFAKAYLKPLNVPTSKFMIRFFVFLLIGFFSAVSVHATENDSLAKPAAKFVIVLDAGHGGKDPGAYYAKVAEKDVALSVTKRLGKLLEKHDEIKVVYTRTTDVFLGLKERADIANDKKADFFVSIHANAVKNKPSAKGNETWVLGVNKNADNLEVVKRENSVITLEDNYQEKYAGFDPNDPASFASMVMVQEESMEESLLMASFIQKDIKSNIKRKDRGVKQGNLAVLRLTYMPSVLVELGFLSNSEERRYLNSIAGKQELAESIYSSILDYVKNRDVNNYVPVAEESVKVERESANTTYKVQIAASKNKLAPKSYNFKKLPDISREYDDGVYRYFTGYLGDLEAARALQELAKKKGYSSAFVVEIKDGLRTRVR